MQNKYHFTHYLLIFLPFLLVPSSLLAQITPASDKALKIKSTTDFSVTGDGSANNWKNAEWNLLPQLSKKVLKNAGWDIPPSTPDNDVQYQTAFKVLYSGTGIYCLFSCEDSMVTATLKGDFLNLYQEDVVEVFLRPDARLPAYFEYELSPLDFELPILILNNNGKIMGWRPWQYEGARKIKHAVKINKKEPGDKTFTWTAELFIPFALLMPIENVPPGKGTQWHANFYRIDYDNHHVHWAWQVTRSNFHDPEKFGVLEFE